MNGLIFLVCIHTFPLPLNLQTKPSPEKNRDLYPPILVISYVKLSVNATICPVSTTYPSSTSIGMIPPKELNHKSPLPEHFIKKKRKAGMGL